MASPIEFLASSWDAIVNFIVGFFPWYNVKNYGAIGDGVTDDTAKIQDAINAAGPNKTIYFPNGVYAITSSLLYKDGQIFKGDAGSQFISGMTEIKMISGTAPVISPANRAVNGFNLKIKGLRLTGAVGSSCVLDLYRMSYARVKSCAISGGQVGILFDANGGQCYFNGVYHTTIGYLSACAVRFQNGANANYFIGGVIEGTPRSFENLSGSAANSFTATAFQGQIAPDDTLIHGYVDAPEIKLSSCYIEGSSSSKLADNTSTTTVVNIPTLGASINQYAGYTIFITAGTGLGQSAIVLSNTSTALTLTSAMPIAPTSTSMIHITRTIGIKVTRNGSIQMLGTTWGGGIAVDLDTGGAVSLTGTATSGSSTTLADNTKTWTVNQYQFSRVRITSGTGAGQIRLVNTSDATTLNVHDAWTIAPDATSHYEITDPTCNAYVRSDLKSTIGAGDAAFKFHSGVLHMESAPNGITVPFDWSLMTSLGIENALYRFGRFTRTGGLHRMEFYNFSSLMAWIDFAAGSFQSNNNFGFFGIGSRGQIKGGSVDGILTVSDNAGSNARLQLKNNIFSVSTTPYAASVAVDFSGARQQIVTLTGDITFTSSGLAAGESVLLKIVGDGSVRNLTFPAWKFGSAVPATIAASKTAFVQLTSWGTTDAEVTAQYFVQP
jgi:hypothetical protein